MPTDYTPPSAHSFLTTYTEEGLVGKLFTDYTPPLQPTASSPPIQKTGSWGSSGQLPHHLYRSRARGEVYKRPLITPLQPHSFPTTYTEDGLVGKSINVR